MKKVIFNLGAVLIAFLIGLAINSACADSLDKMSDSELRSLVSQLREEVNSLKSRVAELERKVGNGSGSGSSAIGGYAFEVDGIHFNMGGGYCDPVDYSEYEYYQVKDGNRVNSNSFITYYYYDSTGRLLETKSEYPTYLYEIKYSYSNKTITTEYHQSYNDPGSMGGISDTFTSYVFHIK